MMTIGWGLHDINHGVSSEFREMVRADHRVVVAAPHMIHTRFVLNEIIDVRSALSRPVHSADNAAERKSFLGVTAGRLLEDLEHPILIETAVQKVRFGVGTKLYRHVPTGYPSL